MSEISDDEMLNSLDEEANRPCDCKRIGAMTVTVKDGKYWCPRCGGIITKQPKEAGHG